MIKNNAKGIYLKFIRNTFLINVTKNEQSFTILKTNAHCLFRSIKP